MALLKSADAWGLGPHKVQFHAILNYISPLLLSVMSSRDKIKAFLKTFFRNRPDRVQLKQSGIVQERVFGTDLGEHVVSSTLLGKKSWYNQ